MTTTKSKIVRSSDDLNLFFKKWCEIVAKNGGTFSIDDHYEVGSCWFRTYTINWPDGMKMELT